MRCDFLENREENRETAFRSAVGGRHDPHPHKTRFTTIVTGAKSPAQRSVPAGASESKLQ
jgi:hypothetical protein